MKYIVILSVMFSTYCACWGQISYNKTPLSATNYNASSLEIPLIVLREYDNDSLNNLFNECDTCYRNYYGVMIEHKINPMIDGVWTKLNNQWIWRIAVKSETSDALLTSFSYYNLSKDEYLYAYNNIEVKGAFTKRNNQPDSLFVITDLDAKGRVVIEFNCLEKPKHKPFEIFGFVHVFNNAKLSETNLKDIIPPIGDCGPKFGVNCEPWKSEWCNGIRSTVQLRHLKNRNGVLGGTCSGTLINSCNTESFKPYILTAAHCVDYIPERSESSQWVVRFNFQNRDCITEGVSQRNYNGNNEMEIVGMTRLAMSGGINHPDVALLEMYELPPIGYNVYYSGWEAYDGEYLDGTEVVGISHPRGTTKKGSLGTVREKTWPLQKFYEVNWTKGYPDDGSSGSGLFNRNKRVVGVFSWSIYKCRSNYGQLAHFFPQLREYIAPNCGFDRFGHIDGADPIWACQENIEVIGDMYPAFDWQDNNEIIIQANNQIIAGGQMSFNKSPSNLPRNYCNYTFKAGERVVLKPGFEVELGHTFSAEIGACLEGDGCGFNYPTKAHWESESADELFIVLPDEDDFVFKDEVIVFPNPATKYVFILFNLLKSADVEIEIHNLLGKLLKSISKRNVQFDKLKIELGELNMQQVLITVRAHGQVLTTEQIIIKDK